MDYIWETSDVLLTGSISNELGLAALAGSVAVLGIFFVIFGLISIFMIISMRKVLEKANLPGWGIFIPIYNIYLMFKLGGRPGGWTRWILFPPVLAILMIILNFDIAKKFQKHPLFGVGLWFFPIVFFPILAFDKKSKWSK
ncbi:MAG TPA: DUF5684 domain-containing protein [Candidatus Absconditabacterales bacterium]|nr:DUF5684 domain-containing protein [Candidatus Absconditabacterales bacterium]HOQ79020.1 DUF5684 domain-containing protein [Candidatus Absconditabacterales bacterium]HPK27647.1 DUF5684 domain-containing protein [Candidatus Absconditabacterales bacterium]